MFDLSTANETLATRLARFDGLPRHALIPESDRPRVRVTEVTEVSYEEFVGTEVTLRQIDAADSRATFLVEFSDGRTRWIHDCVPVTTDEARTTALESVTMTRAEYDASLTRAREEGKREQRRTDVDEFERWKSNATEIAHSYADDNSLCSEFDRCMEEIGLEPRTREYVVEFRMTVTARDADSAIEDAEEQASSESWRSLGYVTAEQN
jgi:hypothetical protein